MDKGKEKVEPKGRPARVKQTILVLGASSSQGWNVAQALIERNHFLVRALVSDPTNPRVQELEKKGVQIVQGECEDKTALEKALQGCSGLFNVQNGVSVPGMTAADELRQGKLVADVASTIGTIRQIVHSSLPPSEEENEDEEDKDAENKKEESKEVEMKDADTNTTSSENKKEESKEIEMKDAGSPKSTEKESSESKVDKDKKSEEKNILTFATVKSEIEEYMRVEKKLPVTSVYVGFFLENFFDYPQYLVKEMVKVDKSKSLSEKQLEDKKKADESSKTPDQDSNNQKTESSSTSTTTTTTTSSATSEPMQCDGVEEEEEYVFKPGVGDIVQSYMSVKDFGKVVAILFERPVQFMRRRVYVSAEPVTLSEIAGIFSAITGKRARAEEDVEPDKKGEADPLEEKDVGKRLSRMLRNAYRTDRYLDISVTISELREVYPEMVRNVDKWLEENGKELAKR